MRGFTTQLVRYLSTAANHRTDGDLLAGFLTRNNEADFAELVRRHGPMVWGICRRALPNHSDAEDAFQTAFMVLVQRGNRLTGLLSVGPWLHRVAVWTVKNVRRRNARQLARRVTLPEQLPIRAIDADLPLDIDAALLSLPEKFRSSIVLCHLLGFSRADAAAQLGCAERTLSSWLSRGLAQLRQKLHGLDPARALGIAAVAVPIGLSQTVVRAAISLRTAVVAASVLSSTVSQLVEGVIHMFWIKKATAATISLFAVFAFGIGIGLSTRQLSSASGGEDKVAALQPGNDAQVVKSDIDAEIDRLEKAIAESKKELKEADLKIKAHELNARLLENTGGDPKGLQNELVVLALLKQSAADFARRIELAQARLKALQTIKAKNALTKVQPPVEKQHEQEVVDELIELLNSIKTPAPDNPTLVPAAQNLKDKLEKQEVQIDANVNDMPLSELLARISIKYGVTFVIMDEAFKAEKIPSIKDKKPNVPAAKLKGLKLGAFLDLVLGSMNATYIVRPDYIEITTIEKRLQEKVTRVFEQSDDKNLDDAKLRLARAQEALKQAETMTERWKLEALRAEDQVRTAQEESRRLRAEVQLLTAKMDKLAAEKLLKPSNEKGTDAQGSTASKPAGAYLQLTLGGKDAAWPFQVKEFGANGKAIGTIAFENADVLGRYLTRTMKDTAGPKELRIATREDTPSNLLISAIEVCKAAGFKDIVAAKEGTDDRAATRIEEYRKLLVQERAYQKSQEDQKKLKDQQEQLLRDFERLYRDKEELQRQREREKELMPPGKEPNQKRLEQDEKLRKLEKLLQETEAEIRKLRELEKQQSPGAIPSPPKQ